MSSKKKTTCAWESERDDYLENAKGPMFFGLKLDEYQQVFRDTILNDKIRLIFCDSKAGTGKSVISTGCAEILVKSGKYDGIVYITAPVQERNMGYLPGTVEEKTDIYSEPFIIALEKIGVNPYLAIKHNEEDNKYSTAYIECRPHNYLRGLTFENKVVLVDEAQNLHTSELKKVLTRMSDNCKVIVLGHVGQVDLPREEMSGFKSYLFAARDAVKEKDWMAICTLEKNYRGEMSQWADSVNKIEEN